MPPKKQSDDSRQGKRALQGKPPLTTSLGGNSHLLLSSLGAACLPRAQRDKDEGGASPMMTHQLINDPPSQPLFKELEMQVADLEARNTQLQGLIPPQGATQAGLGCRTCQLEQMKAEQAVSEMLALRAHNQQLLAECEMLRGIVAQGSAPSASKELLLAPLSQTLYSQSMSEERNLRRAAAEKVPLMPSSSVVSSAVDQFGVPQEVEHCRIGLKSIPILRNCGYVDDLVDLFMAMVSCQDQKIIKRIVVKLLAAKYKIMDACEDLVDKKRAIEIIEQAKSRNTVHVQHMYAHAMQAVEDNQAALGISRGSGGEPWANPQDAQILRLPAVVRHMKLPTDAERTEMLEKSKPFRDSLLSIESLRGSEWIVDDLCVMFWCQASCQDKNQREALIFALVENFSKLQNLCANDHSLTEFLLATEIAREANKEIADQMFSHVLSGNSMSGNLIGLL
ncbi:hypothetical protein HDU78_005530 [Chytriomyces hyalinus]|nr:hypothetical protein HDU78_005530 [Chytriomyces hyalinus]